MLIGIQFWLKYLTCPCRHISASSVRIHCYTPIYFLVFFLFFCFKRLTICTIYSQYGKSVLNGQSETTESHRLEVGCRHSCRGRVHTAHYRLRAAIKPWRLFFSLFSAILFGSCLIICYICNGENPSGLSPPRFSVYQGAGLFLLSRIKNSLPYLTYTIW